MNHLNQFRDCALRAEYAKSIEHFTHLQNEIFEISNKATSEGYAWKQLKRELEKELHIVHQIINVKFFCYSANKLPLQCLQTILIGNQITEKV